MATSVNRQVFVSLPLLRAIQRLPEAVTVDGVTLCITGEAGSAPIVGDLAAFRATVRWKHGRRSGSGKIDLSAASSWRTDVALRLDGIRLGSRGHEVTEGLLLEIRRMMDDAGGTRFVTVEREPAPATELRTSA